MTPANSPYAVPDCPICLVGMPGSGKTTIGVRLAGVLGIPFYDSDDEISAACGKSVADIFADHGEAYFRAKELEILDMLTRDGVPSIIASGGGAFVQQSSRELLLARSLCIWLRPSEEVLLERVSRRRHRPLLEGGDKRAILRSLIQERTPFYRLAHLTVESDESPHNRSVHRVLQEVRRHGLI